jgi:hypothetical protein
MPDQQPPFEELQTAIYTALTGMTILGASFPVKGAVPPGTAMPYVVIGEEFVSDWSTKTWWGSEHRVRLHFWDLASTSRKVRAAMKETAKRLVNKTLTITGSYAVASLRLGPQHVFQDGDAYHGVADFTVLVEQQA